LALDSILVEETDEGDRYDLIVRGGNAPVIVEGKIGHEQDPIQLRRYARSVGETYGRRPELTVIDEGCAGAQSATPEFEKLRREVANIRYRTWTQVAKVCERIIRRKKAFDQDRIAAALAEDFLEHLKENQMTNEPQPEVYLRDVGDQWSVELFFRHHIYKCQTKFFQSARSNLYFAPYFTRRVADEVSRVNFVPVGEGISYVARIKSVKVISKTAVREYLRENDIEQFKQAADIVRRNHREREVLMLLLGPPRLAFLSPVTKTRLAKLASGHRFGVGAMGSRSCTFDDLLAAAQL
jgi:hypothetical protein